MQNVFVESNYRVEGHVKHEVESMQDWHEN